MHIESCSSNMYVKNKYTFDTCLYFFHWNIEKNKLNNGYCMQIFINIFKLLIKNKIIQNYALFHYNSLNAVLIWYKQ